MNKFKSVMCMLSLVSTLGSFAGEDAGEGAGEDVGATVVGGTQVKSTEWIGQRTVALLKNGQIVCSATLLSSKAALTAAHCIEGTKNYQIGFSVRVNSPGITKRKVNRIVVHPDYDPKFSKRNPSDIAIVFFTGGKPKGYHLVPLVAANEVPKRSEVVTISGYGASKRDGSTGYGILRKANVKIIEASLSESEVVMDQRDTSAACYGDSGGPVYMVNATDTYHQLGIASRVSTRVEKNKRVCGNQVWYTRVGYFLKWIEQELQK